MRGFAAELIYSNSMSVLGFQTFKLAFCISNSLLWRAEILNSRDFNVSFPWIQSVSFERESRSGVKQTHFQNLKKKGEWVLLLSQGHLSKPYKVGYQRSQRVHRDAKIYLLTAPNVMLTINLRISPSLRSTTKRLCLFFSFLNRLAIAVDSAVVDDSTPC